MRRSDVLADELIAAGKCPVQNIVRLAEQAEAGGDIGQAISAWKSVLPYIYPKPKSVEFAPDEFVELARNLASVRAEASRSDADADHVALLEQFIATMQ